MKITFPFLIVLLFCVSNLAKAQWHRVTSEECSISASYPGEVSEQYRTNKLTDSLTTKEYRFLAASKNHYFLTYCSVWPKGYIKGDVEKVLENGLAGIDGEILSSSKISLDEYPGQTFVVDLASGRGNTYVRAYILDNVVIQMQAIQLAKEAEQLSSQGKRFLNSLRKEN